MRQRPRFLEVVPLLVLITAGLVLAACGGDGDPADDPAGTVVLVTVDAFRADRLGLYGGPVEMPALERLAGRGTVFDDMTSVVPQTRPAMATLLTGQLPGDHGVRNDVADRLDPSARTIPGLFREAGYTTAAFVTSGINAWTSGFQHTFDLFDGPEDYTLGPGAYSPPVRPTSEALDHFEAWMNAPGDTGSRFAWVHLAELQDVAIDAPRGTAREAYDDALPALDAAIERLTGFLEERSGPVDIVLVGTYGVHLEDDEFSAARGSSYWLDEATLRVPALIARLGGGETVSRRDSGPCWLPDVNATLLSLAGQDSVATGQGVDLLSADPGLQVTDRVRYAWTWAPYDEQLWPVLTAVNTGASWVAFDSDMLAGGSPGGDVSREFTLAREHAGPGRNYNLPEEVQHEILAAGIRLGDRNLRSPDLQGKARAEFLAELFRLRIHFAQDRDRRTARTSKRLITAHPENLAALYTRGAFLVMAGGVEPAKELFATMLERYPDTPAVLHWAAHLELALERPERAFALLNAARSLGFSDADLLYDLACVHARKGEKQQGLDSLAAAIDAGYRNWEWIDQDPDLASLRADPGYARLLGGRGN